jgi:6-phosphogluconolactonase
MKFQVFPTVEQLGDNCANRIIKIANESIKDHGFFSVAFSGGSLPDTIASGLLRQNGIDYSKWYFLYADERVVPLDHKDSNHKLLHDVFLSKINVKREQILSISVFDSAKDSCLDYRKQIENLFKNCSIPSIDLILLGMGPDGHTCSLFPGHKLLESQEAVDFLEDSPKPPCSRITLTFQTLNKGKNVFFVVTGSNKKEVVKRIYDGDKDVVGGKIREENVFWFFDDSAASLIKS